MTARYRTLAAELRASITSGQYPPGYTLPPITELAAQHGVSKVTVSSAIALLEAEGYVRPVQRAGTIVLDTRPVRVAFSRYAEVTSPGSQLGPWETECQRQGIDGHMLLVQVERIAAPANVAAALGIAEGDPVVCRHRQAVIGSEPAQVVQIHTAWYPITLAEGTPLAADSKVNGGIYAALATIGLRPWTADETVTARPASTDETAELYMRGGTVLVVERVTRDRDARILEFLRVIADPARTTLVYDGLPLHNR